MKILNLIMLVSICAAPLYSQEPFQNIPIDDINFRRLYEQEGEQGLRPYIHEAADSALAILEIVDVEGNYFGESNGERLGEFLDVLSYAGDMSSKDALLKAMSSPKISGNNIARGLMRLGPEIQPEILSYLDRNNWDKKSIGTLSTLGRMARIDTTGTYITEEFREKVRDKLVVMLAERANNEAGLTRGAVWALAYFGDESVIPLLEEIGNEDIPGLQSENKSLNSTYTPRIYIPNSPQDVIDYIKEKK
ncbi:hypothetical protein ACFL6K_02800 [Candidatus Latescibacterota bacterium]